MNTGCGPLRSPFEGAPPGAHDGAAKAKIGGIEVISLIERIREWHKCTETVFVGVTAVPNPSYPEPTQAPEIGFYSQSPIGIYRNPTFDATRESIAFTPSESGPPTGHD
jgi:hypothetical protein